MKDELDEYRVILCNNCALKDECDKDRIRIRTIEDKRTIFCRTYKYDKLEEVEE